MRKKTIVKLIIAAALLVITIVFIVLDNEVIFPSAMVGFLLILTTLGDSSIKKTPIGKSAHYAIITFSILIIILNIIIPIFLPLIASSSDLNEQITEMTTESYSESPAALEDHFVQVIINDAHELCYFFSILLIINLIYLGIFSRNKK